MTPEEFLAKIEYEGGWDGAFEYGIRPFDLDGTADPHLHHLVSLLYDDWANFSKNLTAVENYVWGNYEDFAW